tara:strand:+ start:667 stop:879 length:213 start_codon:yes stop_codon:yes gene_type:complete
MSEKKYNKKFNIEVSFDDDLMEVVKLTYSSEFKELNFLAQADILKDVTHLTETQRNKSFNKYAHSLKDQK